MSTNTVLNKQSNTFISSEAEIISELEKTQDRIEKREKA